MRVVIDTNVLVLAHVDYKPLLSVDLSSVANTQNHDLISLNVKHDTIVTDTKSI